MDRVAGGAGGTRGQNLWNIAGWYSPGGGVQGPIIGSLQVRSGNTDVLKAISTERLIGLQHFRDFKGDSGVAIPSHSYSHDATAVNAALGFVSFEQIDNPQMIVNLVSPVKGGRCARSPPRTASSNTATANSMGTSPDLSVYEASSFILTFSPGL